MLSGLLSLALLGTAVTVGIPTDFVSPRPFSARPRIASTRPRAMLPAAEDITNERDCIDEDNSDESSSAKERSEKLGGLLSRRGLALFRTRLQYTAGCPCGTPLPLFYTFCTLLL